MEKDESNNSAVAEFTPTSMLSLAVSPAGTVTLQPGQSQTYTITVLDQNGDLVSGASVSVNDGLTGQSSARGPTNSSGQTTYPATVPIGKASGDYTLVFAGSKPGYPASPTVTRTVVVIPDPVAPTVATGDPSSITSSSFRMNGTVNPNGLATDAWFEYSTNSNLVGFAATIPASVGSGSTSGAVSVVLSGLTPGTTYYYRVAASNSAGTSRGPIVSAMTSGTPPALTVAVAPAGTVTLQPGQSQTYTITVLDQNGDLVSGAMVGGEDLLMAQSFQVTTASNGTASYQTTVPQGKPDGTYAITFQAAKSGWSASAQLTRQVTVEHTGSLALSVTPTSAQTLDWGQSVTYAITVTDGAGARVGGVTVGGEDHLMAQSFQVSTSSSGTATYRTTVHQGTANGTYAITFQASKSGLAPSGVATRYVRVSRITTGTLKISFTGLPSGVSPAISVFRPSGQVLGICDTSSNPCQFNNVPAGSDYRIQAYDKTVGGAVYSPSPVQQFVDIVAGQITSRSVAYVKQ